MTSSASTTQSLPTCALVVPIYNEEPCVAETLARLKEVASTIPGWEFEIVCVNDGSTDRTAEILRGIGGIRVLTHDVNRGYGAALRTGLDSCTADWVFITDADGTYEISDLAKLWAAAGPGVDMVVGARMGVGISVNPFKRIARWLLRKLVHGLTGVMVPDLNSGLRIFRRSLYREFRHLLPMGFSFTTTITVSSLYSGYHLRFLPTSYQRRVGKSGISPIRDFLGFTVLIIRLASYFEPLKFFLPATFGIFMFGVIWSVRDLVLNGRLGGLSVVLFLIAFQVFVTGVLADVVVRRSRSGSGG